MIKRFEDFINEGLDTTDINNLIEDSFTPMCDEHGLDFSIMEGYLINSIESDLATNWITHELLDDVKFMFREEGAELVYKRAFQITFLKDNYIGEISNDDKIESLNRDLQSGIKRFNQLNKTDYKLTRLPDEIKKTFWQIVFYVVKD